MVGEEGTAYVLCPAVLRSVGCRRLRGFASGDPAPAEQLLSVVQAFSSLDWVFGYMIALLQGLQGRVVLKT